MSGLTRLYLAQRGLCFLCHEPMLYKNKRNRRTRGNMNTFTREHLWPQSKGGGAGYNIVLTHSRCNKQRGRQLPTPEMVERSRRIWDWAERFTEDDVQRFLSDRAVLGTFCICYEWPKPSNDVHYSTATTKHRLT